MTGVLTTLTEALDRRFLFTAALPSALFTLLLAYVWFADADPARAAAVWDAAGGFHLAALVAATGLLAVLLGAATPFLVRAAEGYWRAAPGRLLAGLGRRHHRRRLAALAADPAGYRDIHLRYPLPTQGGEVMPTRLGNILRCAELYPRDRYGIDTAVTWPRLYQVLPDRQVTQIAGARSDLDLLVTTAFLAALFAAVAGARLLAEGVPWWRFLLCFWGAAAVAALAYRGALAAATTYGQHVRTAFDVHRGELLRHLGLAEQADLWRRLAQHWYRNVPLDAELAPDVFDEPADDPGPALPLGRALALLTAAAGVAGAIVLAA